MAGSSGREKTASKLRRPFCFIQIMLGAAG
jgi:hypothetical protein